MTYSHLWNKVFSGATKNPRYATLLAIEQVLATGEKLPFTYDALTEEPMMLREASLPYAYGARRCEGEDIERLSEHARAELIQGGTLYDVCTEPHASVPGDTADSADRKSYTEEEERMLRRAGLDCGDRIRHQLQP